MRQINQRFLTMIFACVFLSLMPLACATTQEKPEAEPAASLVVTPNSGPPNSNITILGSGFIPGETIEVIIVVEGVPTDLGGKPMVKKANEMGAFKTTSNVPRMATTGVYTIEAIGDKGTVAVAPLDVTEKPKKK